MIKDFMVRKMSVGIILLLFPALLCAGEFALGVGYPIFLAKYSPMEVRYATGSGINVFAGRFYLNFYQTGKVKAFSGIEGGYVKFNALDVKGKGYEGSIFVGGEYFVTDSIALAADIAPTYISLKSEDDYKASGFEIVGNASVYYYFGATEKKSTKSGKKVIDTDKLSEEEKEALIEKFTTKAEQYADEGDYEKAIAVWKKVLKIDPDNKTAKKEIERTKALMEEEAVEE